MSINLIVYAFINKIAFAPMNELMRKIADLIKEIRIEKNISQESLAHLSNLDRTYISGIECYRRNISVYSLEKIIDALGVTQADFFGRLACIV